MGRELVFSVDMTPIGKQRARTVRGKDGCVHSYTPKATVTAEAAICDAFKAAYPRHTPHDGPVELSVIATFPVPASFPKWKRALALLGIWRCDVKPDWDNVGKITDALNGVAWSDDGRVFDAHVRKEYGDVGRLMIRVRMYDQPVRADFKALEVRS